MLARLFREIPIIVMPQIMNKSQINCCIICTGVIEEPFYASDSKVIEFSRFLVFY